MFNTQKKVPQVKKKVFWSSMEWPVSACNNGWSCDFRFCSDLGKNRKLGRESFSAVRKTGCRWSVVQGKGNTRTRLTSGRPSSFIHLFFRSSWVRYFGHKKMPRETTKIQVVTVGSYSRLRFFVFIIVRGNIDHAYVCILVIKLEYPCKGCLIQDERLIEKRCFLRVKRSLSNLLLGRNFIQ